MAKSTDELIIEMSLDNKQVLKATDQVNKAIKRNSKQNSASIKKESKEWRGLGSALASTTDDVKKHGKETKKTGKESKKSVKSIGKSWLGLAAKITGFGLAFRKALDLSKSFTQYKQGFDALERNSDGNAQKIIDKLRDVSEGTINNKDIMLAANKAIALGVTKDIGKMAELMEVARVKGKAMGLDTTQAFNDIVTGIGRGSPLILDNLGIVTKGWDAEAKAAGVALDQQFLLNKILAQGAVELEKVGARSLTSAERLQKVSAGLDNFGLIAGKAITEVVEPFAVGLDKLLGFFSRLPESVQSVTVGIGGLTAALGLSIKFLGLSLSSAGVLGLALVALASAYKLVNLAIIAGTRAQRGWLEIVNQTDLEKAKKDLEEYNEELQLLGANGAQTLEGLQQFLETQLRFNKTMRDAQKELANGKISQEEFAEATNTAWQEVQKQNKQVILLFGKIQNTEKAIISFHETQKQQQELSNALTEQELLNIQKKEESEFSLQQERLNRMSQLQEATDLNREADLLKEQAKLESELELLKNSKDLSFGVEQEFALKKQLLETELQENMQEQRELAFERDRERNLKSEELFGQTFENISLKNQTFVERVRINQERLAESLKTSIAGATENIVEEYGAGIGKMVATGETFKKSFGDFLDEIIDKVIELAVQMAVVEGVKALFSGGTSLIGGLLGFAGGKEKSEKGGWSVVGERGPELQFTPDNSTIIPNHKIRNMAAFSSLPHYAEGKGGTIDNSKNSQRTFQIANLNVQANNKEELINTLTEIGNQLGVDMFAGGN